MARPTNTETGQGSGPCRLRRVDVGDVDTLTRIETIYVEAFPESERKPVPFLAEAAGREDYDLYAFGCAEEVSGFALVYKSRGAGFALLEYMAVAADRRDRGLGSLLFKELLTELSDRVLLLEIEADSGAEPPELSSSRRRRSFYRRLGCFEIEGLDYVMPQVAKALPPAMALLACGKANVTNEALNLPGWLEEIYDRVYGVRLTPEQLKLMFPAEPGASGGGSG